MQNIRKENESLILEFSPNQKLQIELGLKQNLNVEILC